MADRAQGSARPLVPAIPAVSGVPNRDLRSADLLARGCGTRLYPGSSPTNPRRGVIRTGHSFLSRLGINRRSVLELPTHAYRGVAVWFSDIDWVMQADIAYQLYYPTLRPLVCDQKGRGGCSRAAFAKVCAARASAADWDTGRNSRLAVDTIATMTGLSEPTVQRATRLMKALGLGTEVFRGRQRTLRERYASWRVGDRGRGWASVYALHPPNNPQVTAHKLRIDPKPDTPVTPHPRRGPVGSHSSVRKNSLPTTGRAGDSKGRASRDRAETSRGRPRRKWAAPDPKGLLLARKWRQDPRTPAWAQQHSLDAWARVLARVAAHHWTPDDLNQLIIEHPGLPYLVAHPRKPLALMATLIRNHAETDDLAYRPAYHDMLREEELHQAAADRREAIVMCPHCDDHGWVTVNGVPADPAARCTHEG